MFPVTFTFPASVNGYTVGVEPVIAIASARLTAETLLSDSLPVMFTVPVPAFAATTPLPSTSIAEALAVVPLTLLFISVVPDFKLS